METIAKTKVQVKVKDLREGDDLGGTVITTPPQYAGNYCGQKDRMFVGVMYKSGKISTRVWGMNTTVTVVNR